MLFKLPIMLLQKLTYYAQCYAPLCQIMYKKLPMLSAMPTYNYSNLLFI